MDEETATLVNEVSVGTAPSPTPTKTQEPDPLFSPLLKNYWPSERRAILVHRFFLCLERQRDVSIEESIESWESGPSSKWRCEKMRRDGIQQLKEIERHKYLLSQEAGRDIGWEAAAQDWVEKHAAAWRRWWEELPEAGA
jgi:hypothetical protein